MSVNRLFETIYYLIDHKQTTAKELAEHFEVSVRTVYRDLDRLIVAGFPIYTNQGAKGGIYIDKDFVLDKTTFSDDEQQQILTALQSIEMLQNKENAKLIDKMAALFNKNKVDWIEVDFTTWHQDNKLNEKFNMLKEAVLQQQQIKFSYINSSGDKSSRIVLPNKLFFKANTWYLQGYCLNKGDYRVFRLSRIVDLEITKEHFTIDKLKLPPKINTYPAYNQKKIKVKLKFDKSIGSVVFDEFSDAKVIETENGDYLVDTYLPDSQWLISFIISFGSKLEIIEPQSLKEKLLKELDKIKALYYN